MSGHTLVEAVEDGTAEEGEVLTLFAVVDGVQMPDVSVSFRLWDAAVPALPFVAPLLAGRVPSLSADTGATRGGGSAADRPANARIRPGCGKVISGGERLWSSPAALASRDGFPTPPATRTAFEVALSSVDRHTGVTTPSPPPAAARRPAAPRPGRPRACGPGRRGSRPSRHQPPAALEQVGSRIGGLDRVPDRVGQRRLDHRARVVGFLLRPVAEARPEPVRHRREPQLLSRPERAMSFSCIPRAVGNASGLLGSTAPPAGTAVPGCSR